MLMEILLVLQKNGSLKEINDENNNKTITQRQFKYYLDKIKVNYLDNKGVWKEIQEIILI